jgi:hypothetical protein
MRFGNSIGFIVRLFHDTTFLEWALIGVFVIHIISTSVPVQGSGRLIPNFVADEPLTAA